MYRNRGAIRSREIRPKLLSNPRPIGRLKLAGCRRKSDSSENFCGFTTHLKPPLGAPQSHLRIPPIRRILFSWSRRLCTGHEPVVVSRTPAKTEQRGSNDPFYGERILRGGRRRGRDGRRWNIKMCPAENPSSPQNYPKSTPPWRRSRCGTRRWSPWGSTPVSESQNSCP